MSAASNRASSIPRPGRSSSARSSTPSYANLITRSTRFWNSGGIDVEVGADGFKLRTGTLESILSGGVTFSEPEEDKSHRQKPPNGSVPTSSYASYSDATRIALNPTLPFLLLFTESVRGLSVGAPVEFRGVPLGNGHGHQLQLPARRSRNTVCPCSSRWTPPLLLDFPSDDFTAARAFVADSVKHGLRASLKTGNLLTGQMYVDLDFQKDPAPAEMIEDKGYVILPTISGGLGQLQEKLSALLDKFQALPIDKTITNLNDALASVPRHLAEPRHAARLRRNAGASRQNSRTASANCARPSPVTTASRISTRTFPARSNNSTTPCAPCAA